MGYTINDSWIRNCGAVIGFAHTHYPYFFSFVLGERFAVKRAVLLLFHEKSFELTKDFSVRLGKTPLFAFGSAAGFSLPRHLLGHAYYKMPRLPLS